MQHWLCQGFRPMSSPAPPSTRNRLQGLALRAFRVGLLIAAIALLRQDGSLPVALRVEQVRDFFPAAAALGNPEAGTGLQTVLDAQGTILGRVTQTLPDAVNVIGYSGPTNVLIVMDLKGSVQGLRILHSDDTPDHVAEVVSDRRFFNQFKELVMGKLKPVAIDGVTGATLTSSAVAEGVLRKLGRQGPSLRFPETITLSEVQALEPRAATLRSESDRLKVLDAHGKVIGIAVRTAPTTDALIGYKGPTDTLALLDPTGTSVRTVKLRKSFDTARYVAYITGDNYFLNLFSGMSLEKLATLDFKGAKIEGVSGATETSYNVAQGLKISAPVWLEQNHPALSFLKQVRWRWQDTGHVVVLASALLMAFTRLRGRAWLRTTHHVLLVVYVGFMAGELLSQALFGGWAQHGTPWRSAPGLVLLGIVALLAPVVTRRQLYCHHICPHGALQQLLMKRLPWQFNPPAWLESLPAILLACVLFVLALGLGFNLNALEPFDAYVWRVAGLASILIAVAGLLASMVVPMAYCRYGCPTGALFKLVRFAGDQDRFARRDGVALLAVSCVLVWRLVHGF